MDHQQERVLHAKGRRHHHRLGRWSPHPLPSSRPAGSREEVNNLAGGAWRGLEECWGIWKIFRVTFKSESESFIIKIVCLVYILLSVLETA